MEIPANGLGFKAPTIAIFVADLQAYFDALNASREPEPHLPGVTQRHIDELVQRGETQFRFDNNFTGSRSDVRTWKHQPYDEQDQPVGDAEQWTLILFCAPDWQEARQGVLQWFQALGGTAPNGTILWSGGA